MSLWSAEAFENLNYVFYQHGSGSSFRDDREFLENKTPATEDEDIHEDGPTLYSFSLDDDSKDRTSLTTVSLFGLVLFLDMLYWWEGSWYDRSADGW